MLIYIKALKNRRIICVFNNGIVLFLKEEYTLFSESGLVFINEKTVKIPSDLSINRNINSQIAPHIIEEDFDIMTEIDKNQPIICIRNGKYIIKGGYYDSKFMIHETFHVYKNKFIYIYLDDETQISIIKTENENEKNLYVGTTNGKLFIYKINQNTEVLNDILEYDQVLSDHSRSINDLYIDTKLNLLATISSDKTCNLYTYPSLKLFRVILLNEMNSLDNIFISNMPLPSIIVYSKNDSIFNVYTINGSFILKKKNMFKEIYSPKISKDIYGRDYLIYGTKFKVIVVCRLPLFTKEEYIEIKNDNYNFPIKCLELREATEIVYFWRLDNYNLSYLKTKILSKNTTDNINLYI
jgi:WD40 repeat protein